MCWEGWDRLAKDTQLSQTGTVWAGDWACGCSGEEMVEKGW